MDTTLSKNMKDGFNFKNFIFIQISVLIYSFVSVLSKISAINLKSSGIFSIGFMFSVFMMFVFLGIYAILWQKILKTNKLSFAYINKGFVLTWTMLWARLIFGESITAMNLLGIAIITAGILMVTKNEQ